MSDKTKMNSELEKFESSLRDVSAPALSINRDQLMYDAGWAAASAAKVAGLNVDRVIQERSTEKSNSIYSVALSFASGLAVASAVLLSVVPFEFGDPNSMAVAANDLPADATPKNAAADFVASPTNRSMPAMTQEAQPDLIEWINQLPTNQTVNTRMVATEPAVTYSGDDVAIYPTRPSTSTQLLREFLPNTSVRQSPPTFAAWMLP